MRGYHEKKVKPTISIDKDLYKGIEKFKDEDDRGNFSNAIGYLVRKALEMRKEDYDIFNIYEGV